MSAESHQRIDPTVLEYVKAAASSSARARVVMLVMVTASVLAFTVIWNNGGLLSGKGWHDTRIELRQAALDFVDEKYLPNAVDSEKSVPANKRALYERAWESLKRRGMAKDESGQRTLIADTKGRDALRDELKQYMTNRDERLRLIHVPFFGIVFDMNDMGLFAGFTFAIGLLWLRFSTMRELRNVEMTFQEAKHRNQSRLCYELLAMHQVLTVPPTLKQEKRSRWSRIIKALFFIPLAIYLMQCVTDVRSFFSIGAMLDPLNMYVALGWDLVLVLLILFFTIQCWRLAGRVDRCWEQAYLDAYPRPRESANESEKVTTEREPGFIDSTLGTDANVEVEQATATIKPNGHK